MDTLFTELKKLKHEKGAIASQFKHLDKSSQEFVDQRLRMQAISTQIDAIEEHIKALKKSHTATHLPAKKSHPFQHCLALETLNQTVSVRLLSQDDKSLLNQFLASSHLLPSQTPAWQEAIETAFDHKSMWVGAFDNDQRLQGVIGITVIDSPLFGRYGVSTPFLNYGGVVSVYRDVHDAIFHFLPTILAEFRLAHIEIRSLEPDLWPVVSTKKVGMIRELPASLDVLDSDLGAKVRAQCKKAQEWNPDIRCGGVELLPDFYRVFSENMRDLGTPVYSKRWFQAILNHPDIDAHLVVVYRHHKAISAGFLVRHGDLMEIPWASTLRSANQLNANMAMYRYILDFSVTSGCRYFDFGRSTEGAGTYQFKRQWGAEPMQHYWYTILPTGMSPPALNPDNPKMKLLIALWKRLPVAIANVIGPWVIKGLP